MEGKVKELIIKPINDAGYILDSVDYVKENGTNFLRIIIDKKDNYISVNDCVIVNDIIDPILDNQNLIEDSYIVDICSKEKGSE